MHIIFDFLVEHYENHVFTIFYILNIIFGIAAYKLGFAKKLPLAKDIVIYILLAIGMFVMTIFSIFKMPMTESLIILTIVMGIYRYRLYRQRKEEEESA